MSKRKYTNLKVLLPEIIAMPTEGRSHRETEEHFGLTGERPAHHLLKHAHCRAKRLAAGLAPKRKERP